jgi:hypothetical protein
MSGVSTAKDIMDKLGLSNVSVKVNGNSVDPNTTLKDYDFVAFGEKVKGGIVAVVVVCNK